jgi:hypothetical protein
MWTRPSSALNTQRIALKEAVGRMLDVFSTDQGRVDGFMREVLLAIGDYSMEEIRRATTAIIRREEFFPKPSTYLKALEHERGRRGPSVVTAQFDGWKLDQIILWGWICGYQLGLELWQRVVPLRMKPNGDGRPPLAEYDDVIKAWLPKAQPAALGAVQDDILRAAGPWEKGEPEDIARLRKALHYNAREFVRGLRPSERVDLIEKRAAEIRSGKRRALT